MNVNTKLIAIISFTLAFIGTLAFRITLPVIAYYTKFTLKAPLFIISLLFISFIGVRSLSSVIFGYLVERNKKILFSPVIFTLINALVTLMFAFANNVILFILLRGIQGFLNGGTWPLIQLLVAASMPVRIRGRVLSLYFIMGSLAIFVGNIIYVVISPLPFVVQLSISSILFVVMSLISFIFIKLTYHSVTHLQRRTAKSTSKRETKSAFAALVILGSFIITFLNCFTMGEFSYIFVMNSLKVSKEVATLVLAFTGLIGLFSSYFVSWLADRKSDVIALIISFTFGILSILLVQIPTPIFFYIGLTLASIALKSYVPLSRRIVVTYSSKPSLAIGLVNALTNLGSSIGQLCLAFLLSSKITEISPLMLQTLIASPFIILIFAYLMKNFREFSKLRV